MNSNNMTIKVKVIRDLDVERLSCSFEGCYWGNSVIDGKDDDQENPKMPFVKDAKRGIWAIEIDPKTGKIIGWPKGHTAQIFYKVCDGCHINYITEDGVIEYEGYVPYFLDLYGDGYGDYLGFEVLEDGTIKDWGRRGLVIDRTQEDEED